jgi:hypothetical protein
VNLNIVSYRQTQSNIQGRDRLANKNKKQNETTNQNEDDDKEDLGEENDASIVKSKGSKRSVACRRKAKEPEVNCPSSFKNKSY